MNFATIGTGWIAEMFIEAAKKTGKYTLTAVYSRDVEKAGQFAKKHESQNFFCDLESMANADIDAVYIASPNKLHFEQSILFLEKGKHVICEKPIVTRPGQLQELYAAADENGVYIFEALRHVHTPGFAAIKKNLDSISPIRVVDIGYNQYSSKYDSFKRGEQQNVFDLSFDGGAKFDLGVYPVSFVVAMFGKPNNVTYKKICLQNGIDGAGAYVFEYDDFLCNISFSKTCEGIADNQIIGERGGIVFGKPVFLDAVSLIMRNGEKVDISGEQDENNMVYEAHLFADIIKNKDMIKYEELREISRLTSEILV